VISRSARHLFATPHVKTVRFTDLSYFLSQFYDSVFDGILHDNKLAEIAGFTDFHTQA
jgi:hypothetical protein